MNLPICWLLATVVLGSGASLVIAQETDPASSARASETNPPGESAAADEDLFSGPQPGEVLPEFVIRNGPGEAAGEERNPVLEANGAPIVLIFVHDVNRQSISFTRILSAWTHGRAADGLHTAVVFLHEDLTEAEQTLKRIQHALTAGVPTGVSPDGAEGPGAYGLNRKVMLTVLVGKENRVTAGYALVQPSLKADLPKVLQSVVDVAGGTVPELQDLPGVREMMQRDSGQPADVPPLRPLLTPVIRKSATPEEVEAAAKEVEALAEMNAAARREIGRIANTIIKAEKLADYGTPRAQEFLQKWATDWGPDSESSR